MTQRNRSARTWGVGGVGGGGGCSIFLSLSRSRRYVGEMDGVRVSVSGQVHGCLGTDNPAVSHCPV